MILLRPRGSAESNARHLIGEGPPQIATDAAAVPDHPDDLGAAADARPWQGDGMAWMHARIPTSYLWGYLWEIHYMFSRY